MKRQQHTRERGFSLIELMIVIAIIGILVGVGVPAWRNAVIAGNEAAAVQNLRTIATEQRTYFNTQGRTKYGTFDELRQREALDKRFAGTESTVEGYVYKLNLDKGANGQPYFGVNADPQQKDGIGATGGRHFYIGSDSSTARANPSGPAGPNDSPTGENDEETK